MRRKWLVVALLCSTALTPQPARAEPVTLFFSQFIAGLTGGVAAATGSALGSAGFLAGSSIFGFAQTALGGALLNLGLSYGLSAIARSLAPRPELTTTPPTQRMVNFAQPLAPMEWVFGQVRKGGPYALTSFQSDRRHYGVILAAHRIDGVEKWYVDNQSVEVSGGVVTTAPFTGNIGLRFYAGAPGQVADATLVSAIPEWTSAHNMAGLAYVAAFARRVPDEQFSAVYGNSAPTGPVITPVVRGALVYDPRTETTTYSNNAALVWAWVTENRLGAGVVNWAEVAIEADASDVIVTNRTGGSQRKWTLNGAFTDDQDWEAIQQQIILACDGYVYELPDGTVGFKVGRYTEPTITLTDADFYDLVLTENAFGQDPATEFVGQYVEPDNDWIESASATIVVDPDARANRQTVPLFYVHNHNQAVRALKRVARANRAQFALTGTVGIIGLDLLRERFVRVNVLGREFVAEIGAILPGEDDTTFSINLTSVLPADFDFNAATEEPAPPARDDVTNDNTVPAPSGLTGTAIAGPGIEWQWVAQPAQLNQQFRFRAVGAAEWQPAIEITGGSIDLITPGLVDGEDYEAELRNITPARRPSAWIPSGTVTAVANSTPPAPVTGLTATGGAGQATVQWVTPNDALHVSTRIYRALGAGAPFSSAALVATVFGPANTTQTVVNSGIAAGTYVYWAASANGSGIESTLAGPVQAIVT